jgi:hypothetical protein
MGYVRTFARQGGKQTHILRPRTADRCQEDAEASRKVFHYQDVTAYGSFSVIDGAVL